MARRSTAPEMAACSAVSEVTLALSYDPLSPMVRPRIGIAVHFQLHAFAFRAADIGRKLNRIRDAVRLNLNIAPVNIVDRYIGVKPAVEPRALGAEFVVLEIVGRGTSGNNDVFRVHHAGLACKGIDHRRAKAGRHAGIGCQD